MSLPTFDEIATARLDLIAVTADALHVEQAEPHALGRAIGCAVPPNWPPPDWEPHVFVLLLEQYARRPEVAAWQRYIALRRAGEGRLLIGSVGAFWRETAPLEAEVGWTVLPPHEGRGYATEAARALIEVLRSDGRLTSVVAHTFPRLPGSIRVMEKCGMCFEGKGEEEGTVRYRLWL